MNKILTLAGTVILFSSLMGLIIGCKQSSPLPAPTPITLPPVTEQPAPQPAEFHIDSLTISPDVVMVGDSVTIAACIKNIGDLKGTYQANLTLDGQQIEYREITVKPGEREIATFYSQGAMEQAGNYKIELGETINIITVHEWIPYEIRYDSGVMHSAGDIPMLVYTIGEVGQIVHFTPQTVPFKIEAINICGQTSLHNLKELDTRRFTVRIWNKDKSEQLWSENFPWRLFNGPATFRNIEIPDIRVKEDFNVEFVSHSENLIGEGGVYKPANISLAFSKPMSYLNDPLNLNATKSRSGICLMGHMLEERASLRDINWFIRVEGEGRLSTQ